MNSVDDKNNYIGIVGVIPNNPNENDAMKQLEKNGEYIGWLGLGCIKENRYVLIYVSANIQRYQYLCKVKKVDKKNNSFDIDLIVKFSSKISSFFTREKLKKYGLKDGTIRYCLNNKPKLCQYVFNVLNENKVIEKTFICKQEKENHNEERNNQKEGNMPNNNNQPLNQILYGPPGTGKTYNTINRALEIILEKEPDEEIEKILIKAKEENIEEDKRKILKEKFDEYKEKGQIEFVTFHQSYGYEEFVEGIKADLESDKIKYKLEEGVFKKLCNNALNSKLSKEIKFDDNKQKVWKMSLGEVGKPNSQKIREYCFNNNIVVLGFCVSDIEFQGKNENEILEEMKKINKNCEKTDASKTSRLKNELKENDLIIVAGDNLKTISGIAQVKNKYGVLSDDIPEYMKGYEQYRKVEWLVKNVEIDVKDFLNLGNKQLGQGTITENHTINIKKLLNFLSTDKNYILIIDEINRGNISKIFGELITLIEESKRIEAEEEIKVKLPYSNNEEFGVPKNLYIIGTMNTADRSIAPIDTALRRRFVFEEIAPKSGLLKKIIKSENEENQKEIDLSKLLEAINTRIEYLYDREHCIGHSYLINVKELRNLKFAFKNKILPLLAEYFYEDWENIDLVLNQNGMIIEEKSQDKYLKNIKNSGNKIYKITSEDSWNEKTFQKIYETSSNEDNE